MAYKAVTGLPVQYSTSDNELASGYYLKFYKANTPTPLSMATDSSGGTLLAQCQISTYGYPLSAAGNDETVFVPHLDQAYRAVLYSKEADATNNIFNNANWNVADLSIVTQNAVAELDDISEIAGLVGDYDNQQKSLLGWLPDTDTDGGILYWSSTDLKSLHDGIKYFSPTVPYTATTADYLNGVGETDPSGTGIWIKSALNAENKQSYTATYSANILTVTPEINSTVFATEQSGLIIRVILPTMATTGLLQVNYNGSVRDVHWIDDSVTASGDVDSAYNKELLLRDNGTDWVIISDVSGSNGNGSWERKADGWQICNKEETISITHTTVTGGLFWEGSYQPADSFPKAFSSVPAAIVNTTGNTTSVGWILCGNAAPTTTAWSSWAIVSSISASATDFKISFYAEGRWY